jgi:glycosyltransferase involved in cell wall biosynthesis
VKVLINAASIKEGGSRVVLTRLLSAMHKGRPDIEWVVAAHPSCIPVKRDDHITWIPVSWLDRSPIHVMAWYEFVLPSLLTKCGADVLFSQTNYLPFRRISRPTMLLIQHAGHFSAEFNRRMRESVGPVGRFFWHQKRRWVRGSAIRATLLTVQTAALADAISAQTERRRDHIVVIPHGPGLAPPGPGPRVRPRPLELRIGYITKWGVQKDFETLFRAAQMLRAAGRRFKLVLTLAHGIPETRGVLELAREYRIADLIENHGEIGQEQIAALYDSLDIFAFPSLCESFGFPTVEAMTRGLPIVVAATEENLEVTKGAALTFAPGDACALAHQITRLMDDEEEAAHRSELSLATSRGYTWEKAAAETIAALELVAVASK